MQWYHDDNIYGYHFRDASKCHSGYQSKMVKSPNGGVAGLAAVGIDNLRWYQSAPVIENYESRMLVIVHVYNYLYV